MRICCCPDCWPSCCTAIVTVQVRKVEAYRERSREVETNMSTAWRDSGSIVPVKGNSSMATLYKVHTSLCLTFTNMAAASRMSSGQYVQSTPSTRKLAAPPQTRDWRCGGSGFPSMLHRQHARVLTGLAPPPLHWRVRCLE